jgi:hypothetical protein
MDCVLISSLWWILWMDGCNSINSFMVCSIFILVICHKDVIRISDISRDSCLISCVHVCVCSTCCMFQLVFACVGSTYA